MKKVFGLSAASCALGILDVVMLFTVAAPCPPPAMTCVNTAHVIAVLFGVYAVLSSVVMYAARKTKSRRFCAVFIVAALACLAAAALMPTVLGGCMKAEMRCRAYTFPYTYAMAAGGGMILIGTLCILLGAKDKE